MTCPVCIDDYNKSTRACIECARCSYQSCRTCVKKYLMESHLDAHCMNCKHPWDRRFLATVFPSTFLKTSYRNHCADVLFERERSLFPDTMIHIERDKEIERVQATIANLRRTVANLVRRIDDEHRTLYRLRTNTVTRDKNHLCYGRPCVAENCRGYVHETTGECPVCSQRTCMKCNVLITDDHTVCAEDDVAAWTEIKKSTRPCPKCHIRIHKISGCYQMWCPQCHTAFNYNTGEIENGVIHNPHYYDFLRQNPDAAIVARPPPCEDRNRLPDVHRVMRINDPHKTAWCDFHRLLQHVHRVELRKYQNPVGDRTLDLRKQYMRNEISEDLFKKRVQEREKKFKKYDDMRSIWTVFWNVGRELVFTLLEEHDAEDLYKQMTNLIAYINDSISTLNHNYQSRLPHIVGFTVG